MLNVLARWWQGAKSRGESRPSLPVDTAPNPVSSSNRADCPPAEAAVERQLERAKALAAKGAWHDAAAAFERAIDLKPDCATAHCGQGCAFLALSRHAEAADSFNLALAHDPDLPEARIELAAMLAGAGDFSAAIEHWQHALALQPGSVDLRLRLADALRRTGAIPAAEIEYRRALEREPGNVPALVNLGMILLEAHGIASEAEALFRRALAADPTRLEAHANLGLALHEQGLFDAADALYAAALASHPEFVEFRWNRGLSRLLRGQYDLGWLDYEARFEREGGRSVRAFPYPAFNPHGLGGTTLLVFAEQGLGDEIMFASCVPDLVRRGIDVVLECNPRLERLFARSFPGIRVHGAPRDGDRSWLTAHPGIVAQSPIASLPRHFRAHGGDFPARAGYLQPDQARIEDFRNRLSTLGSGLKIGVSWRGGSRATRSLLRSIPLELLPLLCSMPAARFVSLQYGLLDSEREALPRLGIVELAGMDGDLDSCAALMAALDLVVTVDNTNAHLAGALGTDCWILLGRLPEWRWGWAGERSPWYSSVRLFRCGESGWPGLLNDASQALRGRTTS